MQNFLKAFREFAIKGNVIDLAVAVIIGAAFGAIVTSLVNDIIMPPIGWAMGDVDFTDLFIALDGDDYPSLAAATEAGAPTINYGKFLNTIVNFLIVAMALFVVIRQVDRLQKAEEATPAEPPAPTTDEQLVDAINRLNDYLEKQP